MSQSTAYCDSSNSVKKKPSNDRSCSPSCIRSMDALQPYRWQNGDRWKGSTDRYNLSLVLWSSNSRGITFPECVTSLLANFLQPAHLVCQITNRDSVVIIERESCAVHREVDLLTLRPQALHFPSDCTQVSLMTDRHLILASGLCDMVYIIDIETSTYRTIDTGIYDTWFTCKFGAILKDSERPGIRIVNHVAGNCFAILQEECLQSSDFQVHFRTLVTGSKDGRLCFVDIQTCNIRYSDNLGGGEVDDVKWSPSGHTIAAVCADGKIRIVDVESGKVSHTMNLGSSPDNYHILRFAPRGDTIAVGCESGMITILNTELGFILHTVDAREYASIIHLWYSQDGRFVHFEGLGKNHPGTIHVTSGLLEER